MGTVLWFELEPLPVGLGGFYLSGFIYTTFEAGVYSHRIIIARLQIYALLPGLPGRPPVRILKVVMQFIYSSVSEEESGAVGNNQTQFQEKKYASFLAHCTWMTMFSFIFLFWQLCSGILLDAPRPSWDASFHNSSVKKYVCLSKK